MVNFNRNDGELVEVNYENIYKFIRLKNTITRYSKEKTIFESTGIKNIITENNFTRNGGFGRT